MVRVFRWQDIEKLRLYNPLRSIGKANIFECRALRVQEDQGIAANRSMEGRPRARTGRIRRREGLVVTQQRGSYVID